MFKKILFVEPKAPNLHIFSTFALPRLGSILLATLAKNQGYETKVVIEDIESLKLQKINEYDLIAISTTTSTAPRGYAIADYAHKLQKITVMGGSHVTFCPDEALEHSDFVIRGEGEIAFLQLLDALNERMELSDVNNLSYKIDNNVIHNPISKCIENLDQLPHLNFDLIHGGMKDLSGYKIIPVQTSRGCPFDCTFCSVTAMFGKKFRTFSIDYVLEEILPYNSNPKNFIFFYDDNFTTNKKRTINLLERMLEKNFRLKWSAQVRTDIAKDENLVKLMKRAGCHTLFIGFESTNPESLVNMKKKQTKEEMEQAIHILKKNKIGIHGMFVFGFDDDTRSSINSTIEFARRCNLESVQFLILTPFPGTELYRKLNSENRIFLDDWSLYDAHHVVFKPKNFSIFDLQFSQIKGHTKFYSRSRLLKNILRLKIEETALNIYARKLNRLWKKINKPYLKLMSLIKKSKSFEITMNIRQVIRLME